MGEKGVCLLTGQVIDRSFCQKHCWLKGKTLTVKEGFFEIGFKIDGETCFEPNLKKALNPKKSRGLLLQKIMED